MSGLAKRLAQAATAPSSPTGFTATAFSSSRIDLSWVTGAGTPTATNFELDWSANGSSGWTNIYSGSNTTYSHTGLSSSTQYFYRVRGQVTDYSGYATANATTQAPAAGRSAIFYTMDFSQFSASVANPGQSYFNAGYLSVVSDSLNSLNIRHIGQQDATDFNVSACNVAGYNTLTHVEIVASAPTPPNGGRCAKCTLYYSAVAYQTGSYQSLDKPRTDFKLNQLEATMVRDAEYWMGMAIWLPSDYVEDSDSSKEFIFQGHPGSTGGANNHFVFSITGGTTANWTLEGKDYGNTTASDSNPVIGGAGETAFTLETPVTTAHRGKWSFHVFNWKININNAAQNKFHYWLTMDPAEAFTPVHLSDTGTRFGVQGSAAGSDAFNPSANYYKGSWRNGAYTGSKTGSTTIALSDIRIGTSLSNYSAVHPTQQAQP